MFKKYGLGCAFAPNFPKEQHKQEILVTKPYIIVIEERVFDDKICNLSSSQFLKDSPIAGQPTLLVFWSHAQFRTGLKFTYGEKGEGETGIWERGEDRGEKHC